MAVDGNQQEFAIDDPEDLSQRKRVKELLDRRQDVINARDAAFEAMLFGELPRDAAAQYYRSRIESLILDLWTKFNHAEVEAGNEYLNEKVIDTLTIVPPPELPTDRADERLAPGAEPASAETVTIRGLKWFLEHDEAIEVTFQTRTMIGGPGVDRQTKQVTVPMRTLDQALINCVEFIDKAGIDADISEAEQQTKIDRDLLEEVDEWRQQNVN